MFFWSRIAAMIYQYGVCVFFHNDKALQYFNNF